MLFIGLLMKIGSKLVTFYCTSDEHMFWDICDLIERLKSLSLSERIRHRCKQAEVEHLFIF